MLFESHDMWVSDKVCDIMCEIWAPLYMSYMICQLWSVKCCVIFSAICELRDCWGWTGAPDATQGIELAPRIIPPESILSLSSPVPKVATILLLFILSLLLAPSYPSSYFHCCHQHQQDKFTGITSIKCTSSLASKASIFFKDPTKMHATQFKLCQKKVSTLASPDACTVWYATVWYSMAMVWQWYDNCMAMVWQWYGNGMAMV